MGSPQGTQVTLEVEGKYQKGRTSVDEWLEQTSIANPHVRLIYHTPEGETKEYPRTYHELPPSPREIKPHPYGIEFGMLLKMLQDTKSHSLSGFLASDFCRVSSQLGTDICKEAKVSPNLKPRDLKGAAAETLYRTIQSTKIMAPPTNCLSPIGEKAILSGLYKQIKGEFYTAVSRPPAVYRGNPFIIEAGLAYGNRPGDQSKPQQPARPRAEGEEEENDSELARVIRYANRVPLLYQQSACATFKAVLSTTWKNYGVTQSRGALPGGPMVIFVHMASVWVRSPANRKKRLPITTRSKRKSPWRYASAADVWDCSCGDANGRRANIGGVIFSNSTSKRWWKPVTGSRAESCRKRRSKCSFRRSRTPARGASRPTKRWARPTQDLRACPIRSS